MYYVKNKITHNTNRGASLVGTSYTNPARFKYSYATKRNHATYIGLRYVLRKKQYYKKK